MKKVSLLLLLTAFTLCSCGEETIGKDHYDLMYDSLITMWADSLKGASYKIAFYGDSRIAGGDFRNEFQTYSAVNLGLGGDKVNDLINRFPLIEATKPEITFVQIGGNDALSSDFSEDDFVESFSSLINKFINFDTKLVLHTVAGISRSASSNQNEVKEKNKRIDKINDVIKNLSSEYSIDLIELDKSLNNSDGYLKSQYTTDGVHFNNLGNQIWYSQIHSYLVSYYSK